MHMIRVAIIVACVICAMPRVVYADCGNLYYYTECNGEFEDFSVEVCFDEDYTDTEKVFVLMEKLFENENDYLSYVPEGTKIIDCAVSDNKAYINLSKEALNCGGNSNQTLFVEQIVNTVYSIEEIRGIIVMVDGEVSGLTEGYDFEYYNRN